MIDQRTTTSGHVLICVAAIYRAGRCRFPPQSIPPKCSSIHSAIALDVDDVVRANGSCNEADARTRTGDPFITSEVLYQLSYVGGAGSSLAWPRATSCGGGCPCPRPRW